MLVAWVLRLTLLKHLFTHPASSSEHVQLKEESQLQHSEQDVPYGNKCGHD